MLLRVASGDRLRKATPTELRWYSAGFAFFPIFGAVFVRVGHTILDTAGGFGIWLYMMAAILAFGAWLAIWTRFVPAGVSWVLSAIVWGFTLWLAFTDR